MKDLAADDVAGDRGYRFRFSWPGPLIEGRLLRRYHRFLADVAVETEGVVVAHCVNSGRMEGLVSKGARVWLTRSRPGTKLAFTWQMIELDDLKIGANTALPNAIVQRMLAAQFEGRDPKARTPWFADALRAQFEVAYGAHSRVDAVLYDERGAMQLVEVKNVHLVYPDGGAYFPDSVSERGTKHLRELTALAREGQRATVLFVIQREDARFLRPSDVHDPAFASAARAAAAAGVRFVALVFRVSEGGIDFVREVPVDLEPYALRDVARWRDALVKTSGWERPKRDDDPRASTTERVDARRAEKGSTRDTRAKRSAKRTAR